ncbi:MAG: hypothetical protein ACI9FZ_001249, partial [Bacteroidia bacterium]
MSVISVVRPSVLHLRFRFLVVRFGGVPIDDIPEC